MKMAGASAENCLINLKVLCNSLSFYRRCYYLDLMITTLPVTFEQWPCHKISFLSPFDQIGRHLVIRTSLPPPILSTLRWRWFGQEMPVLQTTKLLQSPYYISSLLSLWNIYCIRPHIINTKLKMSSLSVCGGYINFVVLPLCELPRS